MQDAYNYSWAHRVEGTGSEKDLQNPKDANW